MPPKGPLHAGRVLVAAEQAELRTAIVKGLSEFPGLKVIGFVRDSSALAQRTELSRPDLLVVHCDLLGARPGLWLKEMHRQQPCLQVLMCSNEGHLPALRKELGELNAGFLALPDEGLNAGNTAGFVERVPQSLATLSADGSGTSSQPTPPADGKVMPQGRPASRRRGSAKAVVIGVSTGGPQALTELFGMIDKDFPLPIAVVQHMPAIFTSMLAERLNRICPLEVRESDHDMEFVPGRVILGRGGFHMRLRGPAKAPTVRLDQSPVENSCRPAVDVLFRSAAEVFGGDVLTVVLTGMGKDGLLGAGQLSALGSPILVQDAATSTVWGMPGAIAQAGLATTVLPLQEIVPELMRYL